MGRNDRVAAQAFLRFRNFDLGRTSASEQRRGDQRGEANHGRYDEAAGEAVHLQAFDDVDVLWVREVYLAGGGVEAAEASRRQQRDAYEGTYEARDREQ